ncbi:MAG: monovalent cation/H(+) antiporter subunit G [Ignavibacteria bacterium]|nr:monovalent cation/H(+) antiporter subunit G [Ignavibacteria bacterium]MBT8381884.1 monovalent cation/H(+) antiporter subunit G [Ignavibacteria bacterium]MBT8391062.1 monovalent cation/H(+) antiporter subunit G [Ignavibacteria bacterium]NNJ54463.1 monovalent cation/H(+) antiporter subunit G [Ignavibacteriaceae bacterium]NNL21848.1 monovalent cation/H(+) antiporter subunit G [Ignavibacteriaceae bacterium]
MMEVISGIIILLGSFFILVSAIGLIRMPDLFTRMSATTKASTLGVGLVLLGTALFWQDIGISARAIIIVSFIFLTAPVAAHIIGRAAYFDKVPLWDKTKVDELKGRYDEKSHELKSKED